MTEVRAPGLLGEDTAALIESAIHARFQRRTAQAGRYGQDFSDLWSTMGTHIVGGKLLRPRLFVDMADSLAGSPLADRELLIDLSAAIEMLHFAFLLHDDVIDRDFRRRQNVNLLGAVRDSHPAPDSAAARQWGTAAGVLTGDLMIAEVHQIFARAPVEETIRHRLLDLLDCTIQESVCGEQADVGLSLGAVETTLTASLSMTQYKTATYSFEFPLRSAAIVAGADAGTESELAAVAKHMGTAYQLQDDLLSAFGEATLHGKDPWSDFREGKQTPLIAYARTTEAWSQIAQHLGRESPTDEQLHELRGLLSNCGAEPFVRNLLNEHLRALNTLLSPPSALSASARTVLTWHTATMEGRTH